MKRLAILLSALLWLQTAASGAEPWFRYFSDGHAVIKQGSLYGFADRNGAEVIPCRYTKAYPFNDGIAMVRQGYEVFAIDTLGNRLGTRVKIPQFYNQDFEYFVRWVCSRLPFVSDNEYAPVSYTHLRRAGRNSLPAARQLPAPSSDQMPCGRRTGE